MKRFTLLLAFIFLLTVSAGATTINLSPQPGQFYIYLVSEFGDDYDISKLDIQKVKIGVIPILTAGDIVFYSRKTHDLKITEQAYNRIFQNIDSYFVVCVGKERIYLGTIWQDISSVSNPGVVICKPFEETDNTIRIQLGYPTEQYFKGQDNRSDPRIMKALQKAGKLIE